MSTRIPLFSGFHWSFRANMLFMNQSQFGKHHFVSRLPCLQTDLDLLLYNSPLMPILHVYARDKKQKKQSSNYINSAQKLYSRGFLLSFSYSIQGNNSTNPPPFRQKRVGTCAMPPPSHFKNKTKVAIKIWKLFVSKLRLKNESQSVKYFTTNFYLLAGYFLSRKT